MKASDPYIGRRAAYKRKYLESARAKALKEKYNLRYRLKSLYGLSVEDFNRMFVQQNGVCAICRTPSDRTLHVDHDHKTGRVRSLLCGGCNTAIGALRESPLLARAAAMYLEQQLTKEFTGE